MPTTIIQPGATIFVTGVNGLIGSHVADQLLKLGYNVRGAVRDVEKNKWVSEYFDKHYKDSKFELVSVPDLAVEGCFDEGLKGASAFIHVASPLGWEGSDNPTAYIRNAVDVYLNALKAASKQPSVKRVVATSSSLAASYPSINVEKVLDQTTYNEQGVADGTTTPPGHPMGLYIAIKVATEKACWDWIKENNPHFTFNTILPYANFGKLVVPEKQGSPSTIEWVKVPFENNVEVFSYLSTGLKPQWFISTQDCALLHIAAAIYAEVSSERIFGYAEQWDFNKLLAIMREAYPDRKFPDDISIDGPDMVKPPRERAEEVLRWIKGGKGWDGLEESVKELIAQWA
ncbi:dihydroflavonol-4-reductase [Periconia macrospinosa]|uniref:Dihydroflavonol-4-reductase n=1 Tax=Periconia macrospinosa TaxID=97972 RepID=A0A2V1E7P8_9PLEO|nr:dihydroflavonol-4-reductase [Periconia macrospinosa]